ncbi:unnamed protein product [Blumeria hordei]|uniref:Uncharacterized protein n=1 Tax=Blumeria hordei TaxID=2867405 RepID=A0A383UVZ2_BLUHO|nr:unnamed protein product [Blumeria hordei]
MGLLPKRISSTGRRKLHQNSTAAYNGLQQKNSNIDFLR